MSNKNKQDPQSQKNNVKIPDYTPWPENFEQRYKKIGFWQEITLGEILLPHLPKEHPAVIDDQLSWSYKELNSHSDKLANILQQKGLGKGDKVVIHLPNCCALFELLFALFKIGACPVMALPTHRYSEISYFCQFTQAKAYFGTTRLNGYSCESIVNQLNENQKLHMSYLINLNSNFISLSHALTTERMKENIGDLNALPENIEFQPTDIKASDIALFQLSGGTTGVPKLIPRTHYDYLYSVVGSNEICQINEHSIYLAVLPVCHNFPMSSPGALGIFTAGGTLILTNSGAPDNAFSLIEKYRVSITALVPPLAIAWLNAFEARQKLNENLDISSLKILQVGGAKLSYEAARKVAPILGCQLQQVFGMAEGLVNYTRLNDDIETICLTQGRPLSRLDEIKVVDDEDNPVFPGETGHLLTRGPYTIRGYYKAPEHNLKAFTSDGFYRTGDRVRVNEDGYLIVEGRSKDQINKGGEKIAAEELENHLLTHHEVFDAAVVGMPDDYLGERICAFVIAKNDLKIPLTATGLNRFLRARQLAEFKYPDRFELVDDFPKTRFGKVDKNALRLHISEKLIQITTQTKHTA